LHCRSRIEYPGSSGRDTKFTCMYILSDGLGMHCTIHSHFTVAVWKTVPTSLTCSRVQQDFGSGSRKLNSDLGFTIDNVFLSEKDLLRPTYRHRARFSQVVKIISRSS